MKSWAKITIFDLDLLDHLIDLDLLCDLDHKQWSWSMILILNHIDLESKITCVTHIYIFWAIFGGPNHHVEPQIFSKSSYNLKIGQFVITVPNFTTKCTAYFHNNAFENDLDLDLMSDLDHSVKSWSFGLAI